MEGLISQQIQPVIIFRPVSSLHNEFVEDLE